MSFDRPLFLLALLAVPAAVGLYLLAERRRMRYAIRFTNLDVLAAVAGGRNWRRYVPLGIFLLALTALCLGVARPNHETMVSQDRATVILVVDVSRSMEADDVKPSRLRAAEAAIRKFLDRVPKRLRVGLIARPDLQFQRFLFAWRIVAGEADIDEIADRRTRCDPGKATLAQLGRQAFINSMIQNPLTHRMNRVLDILREVMEAGALMSYGVNLIDVFRDVAAVVDQVARHGNAGEIPMRAPSHFHTAVNLKTAKTLGLDVPATVLVRADEVIE